MKRSLLLPFVGLLAACGGTPVPAAPPTGLPPVADSAITVRFPEQACADTYFVLRDLGGVARGQVALGGGASCSSLTVTTGQALSALGVTPRIEARALVPAGAVDVALQNETARIAVLRPGLYRDADNDGAFDEGEALPLMTHDLLVYADNERGFSGTYETRSPDIRHTWNLARDFSRLEHYVYLPFGSQTYRRSMRTSPSLKIDLHAPTPETSM